VGIGVLYVKEDILQAMPPWEGGGSMIATVSLTEGTTYVHKIITINSSDWGYDAQAFARWRPPP
jgi:selenocysteine lyase/cysteine desulfurase